MSESFEIIPGGTLYEAAIYARDEAVRRGERIEYTFNEWQLYADPNEDIGTMKARIEAQVGFPLLTRDEMAEEARLNVEKTEREWAQAIKDAGAMTEAEMKDSKPPRIDTPEALQQYIDSLVARPHDYGTCVYAMSLAAVAAMGYVAGKLGVSGFQHGCAVLDFVSRERHHEHGFQIVDWGNLLYVQYWNNPEYPGNNEIFYRLLEDPEKAQYFADEARKLLAGDRGSEDNRLHWTWLASLAPAGFVVSGFTETRSSKLPSAPYTVASLTCDGSGAVPNTDQR